MIRCGAVLDSLDGFIQGFDIGGGAADGDRCYSQHAAACAETVMIEGVLHL